MFVSEASLVIGCSFGIVSLWSETTFAGSSSDLCVWVGLTSLQRLTFLCNWVLYIFVLISPYTSHIARVTLIGFGRLSGVRPLRWVVAIVLFQRLDHWCRQAFLSQHHLIPLWYCQTFCWGNTTDTVTHFWCSIDDVARSIFLNQHLFDKFWHCFGQYFGVVRRLFLRQHPFDTTITACVVTIVWYLGSLMA